MKKRRASNSQFMPLILALVVGILGLIGISVYGVMREAGYFEVEEEALGNLAITSESFVDYQGGKRFEVMLRDTSGEVLAVSAILYKDGAVVNRTCVVGISPDGEPVVEGSSIQMGVTFVYNSLTVSDPGDYQVGFYPSSNVSCLTTSNEAVWTGVYNIPDPCGLLCSEPWVLDPETCTCVCGLDNSDCAPYKVANTSSCTCVCASSCPPGQTQDPVTCQCSGGDDGGGDDGGTTPGTCNLTCPTGHTPNSACTACVCATSCDEDEIQKSDCSCVSADEELITDCEEVEMSIETDGEVSYLLNEEVPLSYSFGGDNYDVDEDDITWVEAESEEKIGEGSNVSYLLEKTGPVEISLRCDGIEKDKIIVQAASDSDQSDAEEDEEERGIGWMTYCLICLLVLLLAGVLVYLVKKMKEREEKKA